MRIPVLLVCAPLLSAQTLTFGVKGGGFFTQPAERADDSRKYIVGPYVELGLTSRIAVEGNALYSRFGTFVNRNSLRGHSVEFPVLGKYYFSAKDSSVRPWVSGGFALRNIWLDRGSTNTEPAAGAVVGGGAAFKVWILRLSPEFRYTRWGGYNFPATNPNQLQALIGVSFWTTWN